MFSLAIGFLQRARQFPGKDRARRDDGSKIVNPNHRTDSEAIPGIVSHIYNPKPQASFICQDD